MILGLSVGSFTTLHVLISLIGIASGVVAMAGLPSGRLLGGWTGLFLWTTVLTSATGFLFHSARIGPPHIVGAISLVVLALTLPALYVFRLRGLWRVTYVVGAILALYLNAFVGVVQAFQKIAALHAVAPNGNEPPFVVAQLAVLAAFVGFTVFALRRFHPAASRNAIG
jgi:hypothetical protein